MKVLLNSSFGVILLIFFFNRVALPYGLEYSLLLSPFFFYYLIKTERLIYTLVPFYIMGIFTIIHWLIGVVFKDFIISTAVLASIVILTTCFYFYYKKATNIEAIIKSLTLINAGLVTIALLSLITGFLIPVFWYLVPFTAGYEALPRLKLFELEASHYSFLLLPLFYYYFWRLLKEWNRETILLFLSLLVSLILSFSLGILGVIAISLIIVFLVHCFSIIKFAPTRNKTLIVLCAGVVGFTLLFFLFPENPLFFRIQNLFVGDDTSGRGRTYEAMEIGWLVAQQNNPFVGIGLGQFKLIGRETLINYYKFMDTPEVVRLPNAMAETLVTYGVIGFSLKLLVQIGFFIRFKVYQNLFQFSLFVALFVYQFTGSYLFNEMEYIFWILVFLPKLKSFHVSNYFSK